MTGKGEAVRKIAVVLFNLGGPDRPETVKPFLFNLFNDRAMIGVPGPLRWLLAKLISHRRAPVAREIYARIGGRSPLLEQTMAQKEALAAALSDLGDERGGERGEVRLFVSMRYWHPMSDEVAQAVAAYGPDEVVLLPLYPQFSRTTTGSSLGDWRRAARAAGLRAPTRAICCYPTAPGYIRALTKLVRDAVDEAGGTAGSRVLFSAHGLPKRIIAAGDPYQAQVERTAAAVVDELGMADLDWVVCYQSRVGPLEWIGPGTDEEIVRAGADKLGVVVVPIAFVSEHSETLVELDIDCRRLADEHGVPAYIRVPAVGVDPVFIEALADLVRHVRRQVGPVCSDAGGRFCAAELTGCALGPAGTEQGVGGAEKERSWSG
ncbi:MAG: ferrochelatase [Proteobacteria bacterium]|nr:ferrochelatase [Pseudomonadota bacterium]